MTQIKRLVLIIEMKKTRNNNSEVKETRDNNRDERDSY